MAECVISAILDTDVDKMVPACMVHTHHAPCPRNGEPANPAPVHADELPSRAEAVEHWRQRTHGQRPLVLHHGTFADDHDTEGDGESCWCEPEVLRG